MKPYRHIHGFLQLFVCGLGLCSVVPVMAAAIQKLPASDEQLRQLAKLPENSIANLISLPIQNNFDFGIGPAKAMRYTLNVQQVIPFSLNDDWNLITRTIVPFIHADNTGLPGDKNRSGLGDITQSFFVSPQKPVGGWIMGGGPVFRYPTAADSALGIKKWSAGPTAIFIRQDDSSTYGGLFNHLWSFAGSGRRKPLNLTFMQPVVAYNFKTATTIAMSSETLYDWRNDQWTVPLNITVAQMFRIGAQPLRVAIGPRVYVERPAGGPDWGMRFQIIFPFPK
jgi:hypothetical protein